MKSLTIVLPLPEPRLSPNARYVGRHWAAKSGAVKRARADAALAAIAAIRQQKAAVPFREPEVFITYYFRQRRTRDQQNLLSWLKAAMDGLQDAGVVLNDHEFRFVMPICARVDPVDARVEIVVQEAAGADPQE